MFYILVTLAFFRALETQLKRCRREKGRKKRDQKNAFRRPSAVEKASIFAQIGSFESWDFPEFESVLVFLNG